MQSLKLAEGEEELGRGAEELGRVARAGGVIVPVAVGVTVAGTGVGLDSAAMVALLPVGEGSGLDGTASVSPRLDGTVSLSQAGSGAELGTVV